MIKILNINRVKIVIIIFVVVVINVFLMFEVVWVVFVLEFFFLILRLLKVWIKFVMVFNKFKRGVRVMIVFRSLFFCCIWVNFLLVVVFMVKWKVFGLGWCSLRGVSRKWLMVKCWVCLVIFWVFIKFLIVVLSIFCIIWFFWISRWF